MNKSKIQIKAALRVALIYVSIIWIVYIINSIIPFDLREFGIAPRKISGLAGVIFSPFIHANLWHILSNTLSLFILTFVLYLTYNNVASFVIISSILISGLAVWLFGRNGIHIGASSLIYSLAAFLIAAGIYSKQVLSLIITVIIAISYGGLIWGVLPIVPWISWEGHLFGALAGILIAWLLYKKINTSLLE